MSLHNQCDTALISHIKVSISVILFETTAHPVVQRASLREAGAIAPPREKNFDSI